MTKATLLLQPFSVSGEKGAIYTANDNWGEFTSTWNNQPGRDSQVLKSWTAGSNQQLAIDVTSAVQAMTVLFLVQGRDRHTYPSTLYSLSASSKLLNASLFKEDCLRVT